MKKLLVLLVIILHVNTSMFIPVVDEVDTYDECGNQVNDINSLFQFIDEFVLGHSNKLKWDADDDHAHFFNVFHHIHAYILQKQAAPVNAASVAVLWETRQQYILPPGNPKLTTTCYDVIVPPPEC
jgi:hypothetical protein